MSDQFPPWVILHVPHDSTLVPPELRHQITLGDDELAQELIKMTDHRTLSLFASGVPEAQVIRAPVSRLVVDVERFEDDHQESMAGRGMGAVYCVTSSLKPLRRPLQASERDHLIEASRVRHQMTQVIDSYRARFKLATTKGSTARFGSVF